ncbi:unnamed protein product [Rangifer tarandus platyrhynchus]|uniref:Uncharacterized protein n=1 Tax=Rangifer tarandus platyrhynchus TaxID=3082113 RepID=A0AC59YWP0_RANTA
MVIVPVWPKIFVLVESSLGETCYVLGLSTDCVVAFCKAYGANVAITRLDQRQSGQLRDYISQDAQWRERLRDRPEPRGSDYGSPGNGGGTLARDWMLTPPAWGGAGLGARPRLRSNGALAGFYFQPSGRARRFALPPAFSRGPALLCSGSCESAGPGFGGPGGRGVPGGAVRRRERAGRAARG